MGRLRQVMVSLKIPVWILNTDLSTPVERQAPSPTSLPPLHLQESEFWQWENPGQSFKGNQGFPDSSVGKEFACNVGDLGSISGLGKSPIEGKGYPLQYSGLDNPMGCIAHRVTKSWTRLSDFHFTSGLPSIKAGRTGFLGKQKGLGHHAISWKRCCFQDRWAGPLTRFPWWQADFGKPWLLLRATSWYGARHTRCAKVMCTCVFSIILCQKRYLTSQTRLRAPNFTASFVV